MRTPAGREMSAATNPARLLHAELQMLLRSDRSAQASASPQKQQQQMQCDLRGQRTATCAKDDDAEPVKEKVSLELQVQLLHAHLASLKSENQVLASKSTANPNVLIAQKRTQNEALHGVVQNQQLLFAQLQSAFGGSMSTVHVQLPFQTRIHLGKDWTERREALLQMKGQKLLDAQRFIAERTKFLDPSAPFAEFSRFNTPEGDLRAHRCDITPLDGVASIQKVFDAVLFYATNMEISISEMLGDITIREDDGDRLNGVFHNRFVSNVLDEVQVECNTLTFCKLYEGSGNPAAFGGGRQFAVFAANFVEEDELYPYSPSTRLRYDVTAVLTVTLEPRKTGHDEDEDEKELAVVLTRAVQLSLRKTELPVPAHVMQDLRVRIEGWGDTMLKTLRGFCTQSVCHSHTVNLDPNCRSFKDSSGQRR